jgi:hypothetical protein
MPAAVAMTGSAATAAGVAAELSASGADCPQIPQKASSSLSCELQLLQVLAI